MIDLGSREVDFNHLISEKLEDYEEVSDIIYEQNDDQTLLWLATYNGKTKQTQIRDIYN